jgi:uncharacterized protein (TIGR00369 family)
LLNHLPKDPDFEARVRGSFARQEFMATIGATIAAVAPGEVILDLVCRPGLTQQHGFLHAGVVTALADSACGLAALSLMPKGAAVMSVEFKINLLAPAEGNCFRAVGRVIRPGKTLTVCSGEVRKDTGPEAAVIAVMQATMMALQDRPGISD